MKTKRDTSNDTLAAKLRKQCNKLTPKQRRNALKRGVEIINREGKER